MQADPRKVLVGLILVPLVAVGLALTACGQGTQAPLLDNGPNAGLSNGDLVNRAVTNMRQLSSFHMDYSGPIVMEGNPGQQVTLLADVQLGPSGWSTTPGTPIPGSTFKMSTAAHTYHGEPWPASEVQVLWTSDQKFYGSTDSGQSWTHISADEVMIGLGYFISPWFWDEYWGPSRTDGTPTAAASSSLAFRDGSPRLEKVDGVVTRHVVANVSGIVTAGPWADPPAEIQLWISTEEPPTVRKLAVTGTRGTPVAYNSLGSPSDVAFSPNSRTVAVAYDTEKLDAASDNSGTRVPEYVGAVRLWDVTRPAAAPQILPEDMGLTSLSYSGDGRYLATGGTTHGLRFGTVWHLGGQKPVSTSLALSDSIGGAVQRGDGKVALRPDGKMAAGIMIDRLFVWELPPDPAKPPLVLVEPVKWDLTALAFSPDNHTLAVGMPFGAISLYDMRQPAAPPRRLVQSASAYDLAFSADGNLLAVSDREGVRIWDLQQAESSPTVITTPEPDSVGALGFGPGGRLLAVAGKERAVQIWDTGLTATPHAAPILVLELDAPGAITSLAVSPDGKQLAVTIEDGPVLLCALDGLQSTGKAPARRTPQAVPGSEVQALFGGGPYTLTWSWSRFNEDFGEVKAPPTATIK